MNSFCRFAPRRCSDFSMLREAYDKLLHEKTLSYINALKIFDELAEANIRSILGSGKSADQKWRSCKGALYEYAVCKAIEEIFEKIPMLNKKLAIIHGTQLNFNYRSQIVIRNWTDIMPDADFVVVDLSNSIVKAIISCKTNLRERLTETAYWKRELQSKNIEYIYHNR